MISSLRFKIDDLPVFWRESASTEAVTGVPDTFPLTITCDEGNGFVTQTYCEHTAEFLETIYKQGENIGYLRDDHPLSQLYGPEFLDFISDNSEIRTQNIFEIGCGGMYILKNIKALGGKVFGCDPSPIAVAAAQKFDITLYQSFFPCKQIVKLFDLVLHYDVLEHVWNPQKFLLNCNSRLQNGGKLVFSVPDCTDQIEAGDVSMLIHQHINYFTKSSIKQLLECSGFHNVRVNRSKKTGSLLCCGSKISHLDKKSSGQSLIKEESRNFFRKVETQYKNITTQIKKDFDELSTGECIGFYPPLRAIPYLSCRLTEGIDLKKIRFIDDNGWACGKYTCNIEIPIFPIEHYLNGDCKVIYICSKVYRNKMYEKIMCLDRKVSIRYL